MTWSKAREWCTERGMHLPSLKTSSEMQAVTDELRKLLGYSKKAQIDEVRNLSLTFVAAGDFWLSGSDIGRTAGQFYWQDGTLVDGSLWETGYPQNYGAGKQSCVEFQIQHGQLFDFGCSSTDYIICEVPVELATCF